MVLRVDSLDLGFHVVTGVGRVNVQQDGFIRQLHFTTHKQHQVQSSFLLDVVVRLCPVNVHPTCIPNSCIFHIAKNGLLNPHSRSDSGSSAVVHRSGLNIVLVVDGHHQRTWLASRSDPDQRQTPVVPNGWTLCQLCGSSVVRTIKKSSIHVGSPLCSGTRQLNILTSTVVCSGKLFELLLECVLFRTLHRRIKHSKFEPNPRHHHLRLSAAVMSTTTAPWH